MLDGHTADLVLVAARTAAGVSLFHVSGDAPGLTRTALSTMDQTRKQAKLDLRRGERHAHRHRRRRVGCA